MLCFFFFYNLLVGWTAALEILLRRKKWNEINFKLLFRHNILFLVPICNGYKVYKVWRWLKYLTKHTVHELIIVYLTMHTWQWYTWKDSQCCYVSPVVYIKHTQFHYVSLGGLQGGIAFLWWWPYMAFWERGTTRYSKGCLQSLWG